MGGGRCEEITICQRISQTHEGTRFGIKTTLGVCFRRWHTAWKTVTEVARSIRDQRAVLNSRKVSISDWTLNVGLAYPAPLSPLADDLPRRLTWRNQSEGGQSLLFNHRRTYI